MSLACPRCRDYHVRRSQRQWHDILFRLFGLVAYRCRSCDHRFFRWRRLPLGSTSG